MKKVFIILIALGFASCKTGYVTTYKIVTPKRNFYVNNFTVKNDSVYFEEFNRDGKSRGKHVFHINQITVKK